MSSRISDCSPRQPVIVQWSKCSVIFSLFWKSHCSSCDAIMIQRSKFSIVFSLFSISQFFHSIQSWLSNQNVPLSFHCFRNLAVSYFSYDAVIKMFHRLFILFKILISLWHPVMILWSELSIIFSLFWKSYSFPWHHIQSSFKCLIVFSLFFKSHFSPCHLVMIQ